MPDRDGTRAGVETAAWLSSSTLLLVARDGGEAGQWRAAVTGPEGDSQPVKQGSFPVPVEGEAPAGRVVFWIAFASDGASWEPGHTLLLEGGDSRIEIGYDGLKQVVVDLPELVRHSFAPLDAAVRTRLLEFLAGSLNAASRGEVHDLSERLHGLRQSLRERLPAMVTSPDKRRGMHVDRIMAVDERSAFIEGWMHFEGDEIVRLTAVSPEGSRAELLHRLRRYSRPDVAQSLNLGATRANDKVGFVCFFELDAPTFLEEGWIVEVENQRGVAGEVGAPLVVTEVLDVRETILEEYVEKLLDEELIADHVLPAITRIQDRVNTAVQIESVVQHGRVPESPELSIVVPLYRNIDHLEIQLSQFADDPDIHSAELIYVLDSPEDDFRLRRYAAELYPLYQVPFKVATLDRNVGFAGATNAGAGLATGRLLLLLNSDVLPDRPGWLGLMRDFYDATPNIGALGPKMLYEDDSIQHAGMYFLPYPDPKLSVWVDATYYKGMHRSVPAANIARPVPAVSGACMMIDRRLFEEMGRLQRTYVRGDYEDSHLCLQLLDRGRENWYLPTAELYHLEAQSYKSDARTLSNQFNRWLHTRLWRERMESLMESPTYSPNGGAPVS